MDIFSINLKKHFNNAWGAIMYLFSVPTILLYMFFVRDFDEFKIATIMFGALASLHILVSLVIHINYYITNKNDLFEVYDNGEFVLINSIESKLFNLENICKVTIYKSFALHKGNIQLLSWDSYNHMIIDLEDGTQIVLTSLLMGIHNPLPIPDEKIIVKMNFFRWVNGKSIRFPRSLKD